MRPVRAVICEDEPLALRAIQSYLSEIDWVEVVATAGDGRSALRLINKHDPDLVFLDVRMPGLSGLQVLEALEDKPAIVFTTAFDEYAVSAFDHGAVDYLVKPFGKDRLVQTLDRVRVRLAGEGGRSPEPNAQEEMRYADRLFARHRGAMVPVSVRDILVLTAADGEVEVHTPNGTYGLDSTLGEVERRLDPTDFVRVHRAHLVNLARVRGIRRYDERRLMLTLENDEVIVASRNGSQALRGLMER